HAACSYARHRPRYRRAGRTGSRKTSQQLIAGRGWQPHGQPVKLLGDDDLTAEPRRYGQAEGEVEHVLLVLGGVLQQFVPVRVDDNMAGRAGKRAFASALDIDVVAVSDFEH